MPDKIGKGLMMALSLRISVIAACTLIANVAVPASSQVFRPSLKFCNRTITPMSVAQAYDLVNTTRQTTEGWFRVGACTCRTLIKDRPLRATEIFLMAKDVAGRNMLREAKPGLCVRSGAFSFLNENGNPQACAAAGGEPGLFKYYQTNGQPRIVNLRRSGECRLMDDQ